MKTIIGVVLGLLIGTGVFGAGLTSVEIEGIVYTNIEKAYLGSGGKIIILFPSGGTSATVEKIPSDFLASWNIKADAAKGAEAKASARQLERAIQAGLFRELNGVVYDLRSPQSGWVTFSQAKVIQVLENGSIVNTTPGAYDAVAVFIKNLPHTVGDTDTINFSAKLVGNYSFINKLNDERTIREYDMGQTCSRDEIPQTVLSGKKPFDFVLAAETANKDILASLPEGKDLQASGTGFFITDDGYIISNNHVVKDAKKIRIKTQSGTYDAEVVQTDPGNDLALLKTKGKFIALPIISSRTSKLGETVATIGFPNVELQGFAPKLAKGEIASLSGIQDDPHYFQISVPVQPGNSGGPLFDEKGNVLGVVSAKLNSIATLASTGTIPENVNYAVKSGFLLSFLESIPAASANLKSPFSSERKFDDVVKTVEESSVLILVY